MAAIVSALFVYPVKGCRGISLGHSAVQRRGLRYDRRWMVVDATGTFVTQRTEPRLALIDVEIAGSELVMRAPNTEMLRVPVEAPTGAPRRRVQIWRDEVEAAECGDGAAHWLSGFLGSPSSLVFMPDDVLRPVKPAYALAGDVVGFADGFPLLLASTSSLDDLNARMDRPLPMNRFRPNIVVSGCAPWAEDRWARIRIGGIPVRVAKPCDRCVVTTTDQRTAERGIEPLRTLATFRKSGSVVLFAQNGVPDAEGTVAVGDAVTVVEAAPPPI
jgi:uncharacterized protein YcbX